MPKLRLATRADLPAMLEIYRPYVVESTVTMEYDPPDLAEFTRRFEAFTQDFPWLVCEVDGVVAGYAYAHKYGPRAGYQWAAESTVYVAKDAHKGGIGRLLYNALIQLLRAQGYRKLYALVTQPNPPSDAFHLKMGFQREGLMENIAYKFGAPLGVSYYGLELLPVAQNPQPPTPFPMLDAERVRAVLG